VKKNIFILFGCFLFAFSSAQPLEVWTRGDNEAVIKSEVINSLKDLMKAGEWKRRVVKIVVSGNDAPFTTGFLISGPMSLSFKMGLDMGVVVPKVSLIETLPNLEKIIFKGVRFFLEKGEPYPIKTLSVSSSAGTVEKKLECKPTLSFLFGLEKLRVLCFKNCGLTELRQKMLLHGLKKREDIDFPDLPNLQRVVAVDGEGGDRKETDLYVRPAAGGIWQKFLRLRGVNWLARRMAGWLRRTVTFHADPQDPRRAPVKGIPEGAWKASFVGFERLYEKSEGGFAKTEWENFFDSVPNLERARGVKHLTIDGGTLYWVNFLHYFPNLRTIMLRRLKPMPETGDLVDDINWDGVEFPPMLEEVRIEGGTLSQDEIKELRDRLPAEVRLTVG